jgi:hypothetical protein
MRKINEETEEKEGFGGRFGQNLATKPIIQFSYVSQPT